MVELTGIPVGPLQANCYLVYAPDSREAIIVDPGADGQSIEREIEALELKPVHIVNTHGHGDHIGANTYIKDKYKIPIAIHEEDAPMLTDAEKNFSAMFGIPILSPEADVLLQEHHTISVGEEIVQILHTPGHSPGGISLYIQPYLLSGDALFKMSIGRTDLPMGSHEELITHICDKILTLPDETQVLPGHGPRTTVGEEKRNNPFLVDAVR